MGDGGVDPIAATRALAEAAGAPLPDAVVAAVSALTPTLVEWSVNVGDARRGQLRFSAWSDDAARVRSVLGGLDAPSASRWHDAVPHDGPSALGWQLTSGHPPALRWWQLAPTGDGRALFQATIGHAPELRVGAERLATLVGSANRCAAVGIEAAGERAERTTLYFELLQPAVAVELLRQIAVPASPAARTFFQRICRMTPGDGDRWPKVWVGRSVGRSGGWKFYAFLRGDRDRSDDETVLAMLDADPASAGIVERARFLSDAERVIQIVGLTFYDEDRGARPSWTLYLADR